MGDAISLSERNAVLEGALKRCERESVIEGGDQGDPLANEVERCQALDALADIRGIARHALTKVRGEA